jgi:uncharacterized metal-binding protein
MDEKRCTCGTMDVRVVACSGGSNVGQITNDAAKACSLVVEKVKEELAA